MFVDLNEKKVLIVGAGTIAKRRTRLMLDFAGEVTVLAPEINPELKELEESGRIHVLKKQYEREDLYGFDMVIAASADAGVNHDIYLACKCMGILVNVCSDKTKCDFYFPRVVQEDRVVVGISSGGRSPKAARKAQEIIRRAFDRSEK